MSRLTKNIIYNLIGQGLVIAIGFVAVKYIFNRLGAEVLGIIYFTATINTILTVVLEIGVSSVVIREISAHFGLDANYIRNFIRTFSFFYWSLYLLACVIIFLMAPVFVNKWIHLDTINPATVIYILRILGIASIAALPTSFYSSLIRGLQRMEFNNLINVITAGLQQFGAILILISGGGLLSVIYWFAGCYILRVIIYFFISVHFFSILDFIPKISVDIIKINFKFTLKTSIISIFSSVYTQIDKIIIGKLLPITTLGYYSFSYNGVSQGTLLTNAISQASYPLFSVLFKAGNKDNLMYQYRKLQDFVCFGILPVFAAVPFAAIPLFSFLFNKEIAFSLLLPTTLLSVGFYINGTLVIPYMFSIAIGRPDIAMKWFFYAFLIALPVMVILIYYLDLIGAGLSWIFYQFLGYFLGIPRICKECLGIKLKEWYFHVLRIIILVFLTYGVSWLILRIIGIHSIIALVSAYSVASIIFLFYSYFMIGKELRETLFHYFQLILKTKTSK